MKTLKELIIESSDVYDQSFGKVGKFYYEEDRSWILLDYDFDVNQYTLSRVKTNGEIEYFFPRSKDGIGDDFKSVIKAQRKYKVKLIPEAEFKKMEFNKLARQIALS